MVNVYIVEYSLYILNDQAKDKEAIIFCKQKDQGKKENISAIYSNYNNNSNSSHCYVLSHPLIIPMLCYAGERTNRHRPCLLFFLALLLKSSSIWIHSSSFFLAPPPPLPSLKHNKRLFVTAWRDLKLMTLTQALWSMVYDCCRLDQTWQIMSDWTRLHQTWKIVPD